MVAKTSPEAAPEYALHRENVSAADTMSAVTKSQGCNASMYSYAHVQVVPDVGVNPNVAVWWWSDKANSGNGAFIQEHTPIAKTGVGAGLPYEFTIEPKGRIFFVQITVTTGNVNVMVSGFERHQFS
jgi:hypothetical protein